MKKFNEFTNEGLRDKMTAKSEEDIKKSMGEENYKIYNKIKLAQDTFSKLKLPFYVHFNQDIPSLKNMRELYLVIESEINQFHLFYADNEWVLKDNIEEDYTDYNSLNEAIEFIKTDTVERFLKHKKEKEKEIEEIQSSLDELEDELSPLLK